jgi:aspartate ammonia-lyase
MSRIEHDSIGDKEIADDKYYGVQTLRAIENFPITGITMSTYPLLIKALGAIKQASAQTNMEEGLLDKEKAEAIIKAAKEVQEGRFNCQFPVDMIQGGAGTSANMNANEVICNRALELLGRKKGEFDYLHPNNHVNMSQSTNDVYPTAGKIAVIWATMEFLPAIEALKQSFFDKGEEFKDVIKMGRTQLQDAVPMTLGQEFRAFGFSIAADIRWLKQAMSAQYDINMGATAIGTGINTLPEYAQKVCKNLATITGLPLFQAEDLVEATSDTGPFVLISGILKRIAVKLTKTCNDLRLLASGPFTGLKDINLPAVQPGSSIMPGKVNPVIPEVVNQVCFDVIGNDTTIMLAGSAGQLQLNAFEPIMIYKLCKSLRCFGNACEVLRTRCVEGITANKERCENMVKKSAGLMTAFSPYIGYRAASDIVKRVEKGEGTVYELVKASGLLSEDDIEKILSPEFMTHPHPLIKLKTEKK